ncbi:hypothetical protein BCR43DRAFT_476237 [Syncephalastrum racemosum]|uniref:Receptor L-domain domain-containing protein n=1 Tax=Syncephalastrum racemosum TaxID=13706 RepID=A0A1X2H7K4_SYNRA|nr:hypothetical protein BCR43DRAFT_476237 [Syncephalastrum racemosum]
MKSILCSAFVLCACASSFVAGSCSGDLKISSQAELDALRSCQIYKGTLTVDQSAATQLKLDGVTMLEGDLVMMNNEGLSKLSFPKLQAINGAFKLENNKALNGLDMPALTALKSFQVAVHPALPAISFPAGLAQADKIAISDTTVTKIDGLSLSKLSELVIDNNIYLRSIGLAHLSEISSSLIISANSPALSLDLSAVKNIRDGSFRNLAGISLSGLTKVAGDISFISNTFDSLEMSNITEIGGTLTISNNKKLGKLSVPELTRLGGALSVGDNTQLNLVDAFPHLEEVDGTVDLTGSFDEVQLPKLSDVRIESGEGGAMGGRYKFFCVLLVLTTESSCRYVAG